MATLDLAQCLREARSLPPFSGTSEYTLVNFLRDAASVITITPDEHKQTITAVLANRIQGKALNIINTLEDPTFERIVSKLREELGEKKTYFALREEALNVRATNIQELHYKLEKILDKMNNKYRIEEINNADYNPTNNERIIFNIYLNFLQPYLKVILIQNNICQIREAHKFFITNDLIKDALIKGTTYRNDQDTNRNFKYENNNRNNRRNFNYTENWQQKERESGNFTRQYRNSNQNNNYRNNNQNDNQQNNNSQQSNNYRNNNQQNNNQQSNNYRQNYNNQLNNNYRNNNYNYNRQQNQSGQNNYNNRYNNNYNNSQNRVRPNNNSGQYTRNNYDRAEPMEVDMIETENFREERLNPNFP